MPAESSTKGSPLGKTKRTSRDGIADIRNAMTGTVIVEAESMKRRG